MDKNVVRLSPRKKSESQGPLLDRSYGLIETPNISRMWLYSQTLFYIFAAVSGFSSAYTLRAFRNIVFDSCLLNIEEMSPGRYYVGGRSKSCDFCEFVPVVSSISALVLAMFFIMSGRGGKGSPGFLPRPWRIVIPALLFNIIALTCVTLATAMLHDGLQRFCELLLGKQIEMNGADGNTTSTDFSVNPQHGFRTLTGCRLDLNVTAPISSEKHNPLHAMTPSDYALLEISELASWCNVISWSFCVFITLIRFLCMADFKLIRFDFLLESEKVVRFTQTSCSSLRTAEGDLAGSIHSAELGPSVVSATHVESEKSGQ